MFFFITHPVVCRIISNKQTTIEYNNFIYQNSYVFRSLDIIIRLALEH